MHIAYFSNTYLPIINGVVRSVSSFRKALTELGHNVFVFAQQQNDYQDMEPFIFRYPSIFPPVDMDLPLVIPISSHIDWVIPILKLDVIHTHHPILVGQAAANQAEELQLPLVFTVHSRYREYINYAPFSQEAVQGFLKSAVYNWMEDFMRRCTHLVIPSQSVLDILVEDYGLESGYTVIPTGIDLEPYRAADGEKIRAEMGWGEDWVVISTGRLSVDKNWSVLIKAFSQVAEQYPNSRLVILGGGMEKDNLEELAARLGVGQQVQLLGFVPYDQVPGYLKAADIFSFSSVIETQGLVTMEALASGLPVVAVYASGTRDIVSHGQQGLLVEEDPQALARGICRLRQDQGLFRKMSEAALERAQDFELKTLARKLVGVYECAMEDKKGGNPVRFSKS